MKLDRRTKFFLLGGAFLVSGAVLDSELLPKYGPTVSVLASFALVGVFGLLTQFFGLNEVWKDNVGESAQKKMMMTWPVGIVWVAAMISWCISAEIETAALKQPDHATQEYTQPMHLKGVVRYVTPAQAQIDEIATWVFFGGIATFFVIGGWNDRLKKKKPDDQ